MAIVHEGHAPYAPIAHVLRAINHYREKDPPQINKQLLMKLGYADAYAVRTLKALRLLDLIDADGTPTAAFKELKLATTEEFVPRLEQVVRTAYSEVFEVVDPATATDSAIEDAFRFYKPLPQRDKMVTLFMGLAEAAGIIGPERAPRKRLRTETLPSGRKRVVDEPKPRAKGKIRREQEELEAEPPPPATTSAEALRLRYIDMLMKKAEAKEETDTDLLDRIEAMLGYEKRPNEAERKD